MLNFQEDLISNLKFYRKEKGISQEKLAEMCDCATSTIGCIECGRQTPSFELLIKISDALKIHPADLFLRNASTTISDTKNLIRTELISRIEEFVATRL